MKNFKFVFWFNDKWDAGNDRMMEWACQARDRDEAERFFIGEWGNGHQVQFIVEF